MGKIWSRGAAACSVAPLCQIMSSLLKMTSLTSETDSKTASSSPSRHLSLIWRLAHTELLTSVLCLSTLHPLISAMSSNLVCCHKWRSFSNHKKPQTCKQGAFKLKLACFCTDILMDLYLCFYICLFPGFLKPQCSLAPPMDRGRSAEACSCFSGMCPLHQRRLASGNSLTVSINP